MTVSSFVYILKAAALVTYIDKILQGYNWETSYCTGFWSHIYCSVPQIQPTNIGKPTLVLCERTRIILLSFNSVNSWWSDFKGIKICVLLTCVGTTYEQAKQQRKYISTMLTFQSYYCTFWFFIAGTAT